MRLGRGRRLRLYFKLIRGVFSYCKWLRIAVLMNRENWVRMYLVLFLWWERGTEVDEGKASAAAVPAFFQSQSILLLFSN